MVSLGTITALISMQAVEDSLTVMDLTSRSLWLQVGLSSGELHRRCGWGRGVGRRVTQENIVIWLPPCEVTPPGCVFWSLDS